MKNPSLSKFLFTHNVHSGLQMYQSSKLKMYDKSKQVYLF